MCLDLIRKTTKAIRCLPMHETRGIIFETYVSTMSYNTHQTHHLLIFNIVCVLTIQFHILYCMIP